MELISHLEVHLLELLEVESLVVLDADDELAFLLDSREKRKFSGAGVVAE